MCLRASSREGRGSELSIGRCYTRPAVNCKGYVRLSAGWGMGAGAGAGDGIGVGGGPYWQTLAAQL